MLQLKVTLAAPSHHIEKRVKCNNTQYNISLPLQNYRFVEILQDIVFQAEWEPLISVLAKKSESLPLFKDFYRLQEDAQRYFNRVINLDYDDLSFKFLSETDKLLEQLDQCKFTDLLAVIRKAFDAFTEKLHSKFNRRIKKYLIASSRSEEEKEQIRKLVELIKSVSTDEEVEIPEKKEVKKQSSSKWGKELLKAEKEEKDESVKQQVKKEEAQGSSELNEEDDEDLVNTKTNGKEAKPKVAPVAGHKKHQIKHQHHHHKKEEEVNEEEWEDVRDEKANKRKEKNNRRLHDKFDSQAIKKSENQPPSDEEEQNKEKQLRKQKKVRNQSSRQRDQDKRIFETSKEKPKRDLRVLLGLNGDSDDGWRERYRVERVPANGNETHEQKKPKWKPKEPKEQKQSEQQSDTNESPFQKKQKSEKKEPSSKKLPQQIALKLQEKKEVQPQSSAPKVVRIPSEGRTLEKIFSFPSNGKTFKLDPSQEYRLRVNDNFWIILQKGQIKIEKDKAGYIRQGKYTSTDEYLLEAQDLTITFDGMCNLEDGGTPFGQPKIENFTGSQSQWFHLKELDIYAYQ